jgi:hypothetical protein
LFAKIVGIEYVRVWRNFKNFMEIKMELFHGMFSHFVTVEFTGRKRSKILINIQIALWNRNNFSKKRKVVRIEEFFGKNTHEYRSPWM